MRTLIISDIHANLEALDSVLDAAHRAGPTDHILCIGDVVGYGPEPMACLERLWELNAMVIRGNHDSAAAGLIELDRFNALAAEACRWTIGRLSQLAIDYLSGLPEQIEWGPFLAVHGSPENPQWDYLLSYGQAIDAWAHCDTPHILVGHSHFQFVMEAGRGVRNPDTGTIDVPLEQARVIVNPGSVGQPRDSDSRAAYAIYDDEAQIISLRRVWYDISVTQRTMAKFGLPAALISRLSNGR